MGFVKIKAESVTTGVKVLETWHCNLSRPRDFATADKKSVEMSLEVRIDGTLYLCLCCCCTMQYAVRRVKTRCLMSLCMEMMLANMENDECRHFLSS